MIKTMQTRIDKDGNFVAHQHIDNGGHTFCLDAENNLTVETGFFGYSHTTVFLSAVDINGLIAFLWKHRNNCEEAEHLKETEYLTINK